MPVERDELLAAMRLAISESETRQEARLDARLGARIDASADDTRRHMDVVAEDLKSITLTERLRAETRDGFDVVDRRLLRLENKRLSTPKR